MKDGYCSALKPEGGRIVLVTGDEAISIWESAQTNASLSFPVNPASTAYSLTTARHEDGDWAIDAVSTDGGSLPRNVSIRRTFALVAFGALSPLEAAEQTVVSAFPRARPPRQGGTFLKAQTRTSP